MIEIQEHVNNKKVGKVLILCQKMEAKVQLQNELFK